MLDFRREGEQGFDECLGSWTQCDYKCPESEARKARNAREAFTR